MVGQATLRSLFDSPAVVGEEFGALVGIEDRRDVHDLFVHRDVGIRQPQKRPDDNEDDDQFNERRSVAFTQLS